MDSTIIVIEHDKQHKDLIIEWTAERIRSCFNYGNGKIQDMENYMQDNRQYAKFEVMVSDWEALAALMTDVTGKTWYTNARYIEKRNKNKMKRGKKT